MFTLLAALIGPFSAVLLIPRFQTYPAGGIDYFLNATADELWPNVVASDTEAEVCYWTNATQYPICPCGGYNSLLGRASLRTLYDSVNFRPSLQTSGSAAATSFLTEDSMEVMPVMLSSGGDRNGYWSNETTWQSQPNAYTVVILQTLLRDWISAAASGDARPGPLSALPELIHAAVPYASADSTYPLAYTSCSQPQNLSRYAETVGFHFIQSMPLRWEGGWSADNVTKAVNITSLHRTPSSHLRTQWISLSTDDFGPVSVGLLFELSWSKPSDTRLALTCTVAASWVQGPVVRSSDAYAWYTDDSVVNDGQPPERNISTILGANDPEARNFNRRIELRADWLELLTPKAPVELFIDSDWQPSTLEHIFYAAGFDTMMEDLRQKPHYISTKTACTLGMFDPTWTDMELWDAKICAHANKIGFIEQTIARVVADGLSRRLSSRAYIMLADLRSWIITELPRNDDYGTRLLTGKKNAVNISSDLDKVTQHVDFSVEGFGYRVSTTTEYIATVVAGLYLLIGLSHVAWTLIRCKSSSSWDTATELLMLAWNSPPVRIMKGTSAQIFRWDTYKRVVKIQARETSELDPNGEVKSYLQLSLPEPPKVAGVAVVNAGSSSNPSSGSSTSTSSTVVCRDPKYCRVEVDKKYY